MTNRIIKLAQSIISFSLDDPKADLWKLGFDSLDLMDLTVKIEDEFNIMFPNNYCIPGDANFKEITLIVESHLEQ